MKYNSLGNSDLRVSEVSYGCMSLGDNHQANAELLHRALDQGITLFDTADLYQNGQNEETLGRAFKGMRQAVTLATKVGNQWRSDGSGWDWNPTKAYILRAVEESLKRLQTDYIDLYQLHGGTIEDPIDETIEAFEQLQQQGKIRYYGISSIRPQVIREYANRSRIVSVMMQYSLLDRRPEETCLDLLQARRIGVLARGSVAQGLLIDKPAVTYLDHSPEEAERAARAVRTLTHEERSAAQVAIRFVLHSSTVASAVLGVRTAEQLEEGIRAAGLPPLSEQEIGTLRRAVKANVYAQYR